MEKVQFNLTTCDSVVVFEKGIKIPYIDKTVYGFLFEQYKSISEEEMTNNIHKYIEYISALISWCKDGGTVSEDTKTWYKDGNEYPFSTQKGYFSDKYLPNAYANNPINYVIKYGCNPKFETGDLEGDLIIKNIIREEWKK